ncbi:MAG: hypothetical protein VX265_06030, partial [Myxococcota bacterium]|nr:hypothetical protein [Myxococcota bacterium]
MPSSSKLSLALAAASLAACREPGDTKSNAEPTAEIRSHAAADTVREGYPETLTGTVGDPDHAMDALTVAWVVDGVEVCADSAPDAEGTVSCAHTFGPTGGVVQLDVRDPDGGAGS